MSHPALVDFCAKLISRCTNHLRELERSEENFSYLGLVATHLNTYMSVPAVVSDYDGVDAGSKMLEMQAEMITAPYDQQVVILFEHFPRLKYRLISLNFGTEDFILDVWAIMWVRAFAWGLCHFFVPGERVPVAYYGSQLPVWIS
jgi:hypothetical protein